jgi:transcription initiation factor TFIIF subunit alpha
MEWNIMHNKGNVPERKAKRERYEEDYVREGRNIGRGLEGGVDEELDFNADEEFQDDDDINTFYNDGDAEEKQLQEERQKKEYRMANYTFGDRMDKEDDEEEEDLFGDKQKLSKDGKRLRRLQRKQALGEDADMFESSDSDSDSDDDEDEKEKEKEKEKERRPPGSAEKSRPGSRAGSRPPDGRSGSPAPRLHPPGQRPGAGAQLLAKRAASRGVSPRPPGAAGSSRAGSPLARGSSPVGREASPAVRAGSPALRGSSPGTREGTPNAKPGKRKATASPLDPGRPPKRRSEEATPPKKRKGGSATPVVDPEERFEGMIERRPVLEWLQGLTGPVTMKQAAGQWGRHMKMYPAVKVQNHKRLAGFIKEFADTVPTDPPTFDAAGKPERLIRIKERYRLH